MVFFTKLENGGTKKNEKAYMNNTSVVVHSFKVSWFLEAASSVARI